MPYCRGFNFSCLLNSNSNNGLSMSATTAQKSQTFGRAVRKIKVAAAVTSLAKSWQSWANEHTDKQETIPSGWLPDSIIEEEKEKEKERSNVKLPLTPHIVSVGDEDNAESKIKTAVVSKPTVPKCTECSPDLINSIKEKMRANQTALEEQKNFFGNESPTRRRHCGWKTKPCGQKNEKKVGSRSSSMDTEDSGLGEDSSDNSDQSEVKPNKAVNRPKIKVTTMNDLRSKWQTFAEEHVEGQKLNPFSEDFDYDHAMASRLQKGDAGYGRPKEGSKTAQRADRAQKHIYKEMEELCFIIRDMGDIDREGRVYVTFGRLFDRYVKISDKVVGILLRCRKHKMVDFEGEMLWQGRDDAVKIILLV